mmetsp:Transcript_40222/g.106194  ORF Transcript_40222/g.106194 Transcript_40222/m.106194 type:complete len:201 (-) Transcript_40222:668-1270(-)
MREHAAIDVAFAMERAHNDEGHCQQNEQREHIQVMGLPAKEEGDLFSVVKPGEIQKTCPSIQPQEIHNIPAAFAGNVQSDDTADEDVAEWPHPCAGKRSAEHMLVVTLWGAPQLRLTVKRQVLLQELHYLQLRTAECLRLPMVDPTIANTVHFVSYLARVQLQQGETGAVGEQEPTPRVWWMAEAITQNLRIIWWTDVRR